MKITASAVARRLRRPAGGSPCRAAAGPPSAERRLPARRSRHARALPDELRGDASRCDHRVWQLPKLSGRDSHLLVNETLDSPRQFPIGCLFDELKLGADQPAPSRCLSDRRDRSGAAANSAWPSRFSSRVAGRLSSVR